MKLFSIDTFKLTENSKHCFKTLESKLGLQVTSFPLGPQSIAFVMTRILINNNQLLIIFVRIIVLFNIYMYKFLKKKNGRKKPASCFFGLQNVFVSFYY